MAHNLHLIVVRAENGEEACDEAESQLFDWGTENNWRTMCGAVNEDNEVYKANEGRYEPDEKSDTIEKINLMVQDLIGNFWMGEEAKKLLKEGKNIEDMTSNQLWSLSKYALDLMEQKILEESRKSMGKPIDGGFDVLTEIFNSYDYEEFGVTNFSTEGEGKLWVVFCDMHS